MNSITYSAQDVAKLLGISRTSAYALFQNPEFPSFRVGSRLLVTRSKFEAWLESASK